MKILKTLSFVAHKHFLLAPQKSYFCNSSHSPFPKFLHNFHFNFIAQTNLSTELTQKFWPQSGVVMHDFNRSTWKAEAGTSL